MGDFSRPKRPMARHKRWISRCEVRNWMGQGDNMRLIYLYIYIHIYMYKYLHLHLYLYLYLFISISIPISISISIYTYINMIYIYYIDYAVDRCGSLEYSYVCLYLSWNWIPSPNGSSLAVSHIHHENLYTRGYIMKNIPLTLYQPKESQPFVGPYWDTPFFAVPLKVIESKSRAEMGLRLSNFFSPHKIGNLGDLQQYYCNIYIIYYIYR